MAVSQEPNYVLGRGKVYFAAFTDAVNKIPGPERYIGNTPEMSLTISQDTLDHFNSDAGIKEKDESITLQVNRTGQVTCDNIDIRNLAMFFFGSFETVSDAGSVEEEVFTAGEQGLYYQLGISDARPAGAVNILGADADSNSAAVGVVVTAGDETSSNSGAGATLVAGTDYEMDYALGRLYVPAGSAITEDSLFTVAYTVKASTFERVISGSSPVAGALRYIADNPVGKNSNIYLAYVKISPNGDYNLKGDDWNVIPFNLEVLKLPTRPAILVDGRPG